MNTNLVLNEQHDINSPVSKNWTNIPLTEVINT